MNGNGSGFAGNHLGVNLAYTKFFFVTPLRDDETTRVKLRAAGGIVGRGFFNDFDAEGRDTPPHETIQFLVRADGDGPERQPGAPYAMQVCSKYRPRLKETDVELRRRVGDFAEVTAFEGAVRVPQYTSAEMHAYAYKPALPRASGRVQKNVIIIPMNKSTEWWEKAALDRQTYFYPHADGMGARVKGHARAAEPGITTIYQEAVLQPRRPQPGGRVGFRHLLRMRRRIPGDIRSDLLLAARCAAEPGMAVCDGRAGVARQARPTVVKPASGFRPTASGLRL